MIHRKTINLDSETQRLIAREAKRRRVSQSEVIRDAVRGGLKGNGGAGRKRKKTGDPLWDDHATFEGPPDLIKNLEQYLYGTDSDE